MRLQVSHLTKYVYREPVIDSVNEVRLTPKTEDCQTCCDHSISIQPFVSLFPYTDYFGNTVHYFFLFRFRMESLSLNRALLCRRVKGA
ncbi:hypothetical protein GCM10020331_043970 [Ectobacillus funiculus]